MDWSALATLSDAQNALQLHRVHNAEVGRGTGLSNKQSPQLIQFMEQATSTE